MILIEFDFNLYRDDPLELPYPDLNEFIMDLNQMMAMVVDGPL